MNNHWVLTACIAEVQPLRYTPAGLPALDIRLEHESLQREAGADRQVKASVKALAFGALAERLARQALGSVWKFQGFLATGRGGKGLVFHIQDIQQN
ncbi:MULTISPECIES: primosomal replication protein N [Diaphorobacter]|uniref:primosomal replication protein N n=1 Tax=Diaphorobacter TaxID=238749 RepID=UPI00258DAF2A|nr:MULTISPECIES: primosomal replication protein N [Diaphorobacter]